MANKNIYYLYCRVNRIDTPKYQEQLSNHHGINYWLKYYAKRIPIADCIGGHHVSCMQSNEIEANITEDRILQE